MKKILLLLLCLLLVCSTVSCTSTPSASEAPSASDITIAIIPKALDNAIFLDTKTAGEEKGKELGISVEWTGSVSSIASEQVAIIEGLIEKGVDGMLISCNDADALKDVIDRAVDAGIAVATFDSDSPDSKRALYIGSDNYGIGKKCAEYVNELIPDGGKIAVLTGVLGAPNLETRIVGLKENVNSNIEILPIQSGDDDVQKSVEVVNQFTGANPDLEGWVFVGGWPFFADPDSLTELSKFMGEGKVCISVDTFYPMLQFIDMDMAQVLIGQDYSKMGSEGVQYLYDMIKNNEKPFEEVIDTGFEIVDKTNIEEVLKTKTPW